MTLCRTLRARLALQYAGVLALLLCLFSAGVYFGLRTVLGRNLDASLWSIAESEVASASDAPDGAVHFHEVSPNPLRAGGVARLDKLVQLRTFPQGRLVGKSRTLGASELPLSAQARARLARGEVVFETVRTPASPPIRMISLPISVQGEVRYVMQVGASLAPLQTTLRRLLGVLLVLDASALGLTALAGSFLARRALRPIGQLVRTLERIEGQSLHRRLAVVTPHDELGRLTTVLNRMLDRLERSFRSQQRFIADASHELRAPLASVQLALELALRRPRTAQEYRQAVQSALEDVAHLSRLVEDLLTLSRADSGKLEIARRPVPLASLLQQVVAAFAQRAKEKQLEVAVAVPEVVVAGEPALLFRLFANLLDNALRYTPAPGQITLTGAADADVVRVTVRDTGIGIPAEHLPRIFERFYRVESERTRETGGSGLGLAICQEIVRAHGGTLTVTSTVGQGSAFTVSLPLYNRLV